MQFKTVQSGLPVSYTHLDVYKRQKEENEENMLWFMNNHPFKLESIDPYLPEELHSETTACLLYTSIDIPGKFSIYNSLTAIAICRHFKVSEENILKALKVAKVRCV